MQELIEGKTHFFTDSEEKITRDMPVFYNPVMKLNRDLTLAVLLAQQQLSEKELRLGFPMEASGIRVARILHELISPNFLKPSVIALNDLSEYAIDFAKKNIAHNIGTFDPKLVNISVNEANIFLRSSPGFDYIDIDPFGTPNPFLDSAVQRISREGILAVTATDTSALAGTYPTTTARKYWSVPSRTWVMHEAGLRILIRKVQLIGAQYEKALVPVLSLATDHYYRIFFRCERSHAPVKEVLQQHAFLHVCTSCLQVEVSAYNTGGCAKCHGRCQTAGPLWVGQLHDAEFVAAMRSQAKKLDEKTAKQLEGLLSIVEAEAKMKVVGFLDIHEFASVHKIAAAKTEDVLKILGSHGAPTHIVGHGVKTDLPMEEVERLLKK